MNQHEYVAGFFGVLIGFTLTELIRGVAETFKNLHRINYYYPHALSVVLLFFLILLNFFDMFTDFRAAEDWTPIVLIGETTPLIFVCFFCYMLFPSFGGDDVVDFRAHFMRILPTILKLGLVVIVLTFVGNNFWYEKDLFDIANIVLACMFILSVVCLLYKKDWAIYLLFAILLPGVMYWTLTLKLR